MTCFSKVGCFDYLGFSRNIREIECRPLSDHRPWDAMPLVRGLARIGKYVLRHTSTWFGLVCLALTWMGEFFWLYLAYALTWFELI